MCRSRRAVFCTVTSDTQTGLDCWCRILSFRLSYQTLEPGCRSIRAGKNILQIGTSTWSFMSTILYSNQFQCVVTWEEVAAVFPQLEGLWVKASGALVGVGAVPLPHGLDVFAAVGVQEQDHRVVLDVVEPFHCSRSDVQKRVPVLEKEKKQWGVRR